LSGKKRTAKRREVGARSRVKKGGNRIFNVGGGKTVGKGRKSCDQGAEDAPLFFGKLEWGLIKKKKKERNLRREARPWKGKKNAKNQDRKRLACQGCRRQSVVGPNKSNHGW